MTLNRCVFPLLLILASVAPVGCVGNRLEVKGNENGSEPINEAEANEYKKAIVRCYKNGGSRIVKIQGVLRCY